MSQSKPAHCIYMVIQEWIPAFAGRTEPHGKDVWRSDDLASFLARTTDDVIPVDHRHTGGQCPADGAVLLGGQPDRLDNVVHQNLSLIHISEPTRLGMISY